MTFCAYVHAVMYGLCCIALFRQGYSKKDNIWHAKVFHVSLLLNLVESWNILTCNIHMFVWNINRSETGRIVLRWTWLKLITDLFEILSQEREIIVLLRIKVGCVK